MQASSRKISGLYILLMIAVVITAIVHLSLGSDFLTNPGDIMFLLNGIGYIVLTVLFIFPIAWTQPYHEIIRWVLVGYTVLTIILWVVMNGKIEPVGIITKLSELAIIVILIIDRPKK
jgi:hypothetical protein